MFSICEFGLGLPVVPKPKALSPNKKTRRRNHLVRNLSRDPQTLAPRTRRQHRPRPLVHRFLSARVQHTAAEVRLGPASTTRRRINTGQGGRALSCASATLVGERMYRSIPAVAALIVLSTCFPVAAQSSDAALTLALQKALDVYLATRAEPEHISRCLCASA